MKEKTTAVLLACLFTAGVHAKDGQHFGTRSDDSFKEVKASFESPDMIYAPLMYWFWDEPIDVDKLDFGPWECIFYCELEGKRKKRVLVEIIEE